MKELKELLEKYFKNDKDIKILSDEDNKRIDFIINEKYNFKDLLIYYRNEMIYIDELNEENQIELFSLNYLLFEYDEMRMNLLIIQFIKNYIDIIE